MRVPHLPPSEGCWENILPSSPLRVPLFCLDNENPEVWGVVVYDFPALSDFICHLEGLNPATFLTG